MTITTTEREPTAGPSDAISPAPIMTIAAGFMAAKHLFAANELGLFEALADSPAALSALAARTGLPHRAARISADAMVALGLLEHDGDLYRNTPVTATFLAGNGPADLRPFLKFWDRISYPAWTALAEALASGPPQQIFDLDAEGQAIASAGIEAILAGPSRTLPEIIQLTGRRMLDIGGGTGSWSIAAAQRHADVRATVLDLPAVAAMASGRVADAGLADRIDVLAADVLADALPVGYDTFLMANLVHYFSPETNRDLLRRIRAVAPANARLLLADFWTDPTHTEPVHAALMAGEFAVHLRDGDVYSVAEARAWLGETGWRFESHHPLAGPQSVIVASPVNLGES